MGAILSVRVVLILVVFAVFIGLMVAKKPPIILALPVLGVVVTVIAGVLFLKASKTDGQTIMGFAIGQGVSGLAGTIIATTFGGVFARVTQKQGISDTIIRKVTELVGDKPHIITFVLTVTATLIFSAIGDTGPIIMVSTIVIPLMLFTGIPDIAVASLVLLRISTGGLFNISNYQFYIDATGMDMKIAKSSSLTIGILSAVAIILCIVLNINRKNTRSSWAMSTKRVEKEVGVPALPVPIAPVLPVFLFKFSVELSFLTTIIYTILTTKPKQIIQIASGSFMGGIQDVSGMIALMVGIGTLSNGISTKGITALIQPLIQAVMPFSLLVYVVLFTLLPPLILYRGSLNMYGLDSGLANIMMMAGTLGPAAIGMTLRATGMVQGASDPTNTQSVVVADFAKVDVNAILKPTLPYAVLMTLGTLIYTMCLVL